MRKQVLTTIAVLPLLLNLSQAAQRWTVESPQPYGIPSEDSGGSAYLGVDIADITSDRLGALKLKEEKGVEVTMVDQDAPAGKAGIKEHDVILTLNGTAIESKTQLHRMIRETPAGRLVTLGLSRDGQPLTIKVQLANRSKEWGDLSKDKFMDKDFHVQIPPIPNIPPMPNMPDIASTSKEVREAKRALSRCLAGLSTGSPKMISGSKLLAKVRLEPAERLHYVVSNRQSPPRCLSCGSFDHKELPLSGYPDGKRTTLPIQHPVCEGNFVIDDRCPIMAEIRGPDRYYTLEGICLRSVSTF